MKLVRGIFLGCILVGFVSLLFVLSPSRRSLEDPGQGSDIETEEDIFVEGLSFSEWEEDRLNWSMEAESGRYHHNKETASFDQVAATFFPAAGGKMRLRAKSVEYDLQTRVLAARDSVRGKSDQGYDFATESLVYEGATREVRTDDKVTLEKDRLTIQGTGMKGSLMDHTFRLLSHVRAVFVPQGTVP